MDVQITFNNSNVLLPNGKRNGKITKSAKTKIHKKVVLPVVNNVQCKEKSSEDSKKEALSIFSDYILQKDLEARMSNMQI